jgi:aspartate/tyrosine/aromatic aminotransferase
VRKADELLAASNLDKEYLPIDGDQEFLRCVKEMVYGEELFPSMHSRIAALQAIGGTGALSIGANLMARHGLEKVFVSNLTWPNHKGVFAAANVKVETYPYYDASRHCVDMATLCEFVSKIDRGSLLLLHTCCHNPTGSDPTKEQWQELAQVMHRQDIIPFFDLAYQGFGEGFEEDAYPIRLFAQQFEEMVVAYSFSKNLGLYGERVGALLIQTARPESVAKVVSQAKLVIREYFSSPPVHGERLVKTVYDRPELRQLWMQELSSMRERLIAMRRALASGLAAKNTAIDFHFLSKQHGMFAFLGLNKDQSARLTGEYGIHLPSNGRINLAGLNDNNLEYVIDAISEVF